MLFIIIWDYFTEETKQNTILTATKDIHKKYRGNTQFEEEMKVIPEMNS